MKRLIVCVILLAGLSACGGVSAPGGGKCNNGICISVQAAEPIRVEEPITITISVTMEKEIPELKVFLYSYPPVLIEDGQTWTERGVNWEINTKATGSQVFTRKVRVPPKEGVFDLIAEAYAPSVRVVDSLSIHLTRDGGKVYLAGTPVPLGTPGKPVPAVTITPGPSPTRIPQYVPSSTPQVKPTGTAIPTPIQKSYP
jgi:hypothetical protein